MTENTLLSLFFFLKRSPETSYEVPSKSAARDVGNIKELFFISAVSYRTVFCVTPRSAAWK